MFEIVVTIVDIGVGLLLVSYPAGVIMRMILIHRELKRAKNIPKGTDIETVLGHC